MVALTETPEFREFRMRVREARKALAKHGFEALHPAGKDWSTSFASYPETGRHMFFYVVDLGYGPTTQTEQELI
jgi:hypothetical protein